MCNKRCLCVELCTTISLQIVNWMSLLTVLLLQPVFKTCNQNDNCVNDLFVYWLSVYCVELSVRNSIVKSLMVLTLSPLLFDCCSKTVNTIFTDCPLTVNWMRIGCRLSIMCLLTGNWVGLLWFELDLNAFISSAIDSLRFDFYLKFEASFHLLWFGFSYVVSSVAMYISNWFTWVWGGERWCESIK